MAAPNKETKREEFTVDHIKGHWDKAVYVDNNPAHVDNLMSVVLHLGTEHWALRRRMMVIEKLIEAKKPVNEAAIDAYEPSDAERARWDAERDDFIERVYSVLTRETQKS